MACRTAHDASNNNPEIALQKKRSADRDLLFVAVVDAIVVGTAMAGYDGHRGWIYSVAVQPEYEGTGIGRALIEHAERALMIRGCLKLNLQVRTSNTRVIGFYQKPGFQVVNIVSVGKRLY